MEPRPELGPLLERANRDDEILAVLLFGSTARGEGSRDSDLDVCLVLVSDSQSEKALSEKRLDYLADFDLDIHVFQSLPLYIQSRVLEDGQVLFCRDMDQLYETAFASVRAFERFKRVHDAYLQAVADAGS